MRRAEITRLRVEHESSTVAQALKHMRWALLRRGSRVRGRTRQKADGFLDYWSFRAMRGRLEPMKKVARMLRAQ